MTQNVELQKLTLTRAAKGTFYCSPKEGKKCEVLAILNGCTPIWSASTWGQKGRTFGAWQLMDFPEILHQFTHKTYF